MRRARSKRIRHDGGVGLELACALENGRELTHHPVEKNFLAVEAAPPRRAALHGDVLDRRLVVERLVQMVDVAHLGRARVRSI